VGRWGGGAMGRWENEMAGRGGGRWGGGAVGRQGGGVAGQWMATGWRG
jgi:hypothetical protein